MFWSSPPPYFRGRPNPSPEQTPSFDVLSLRRAWAPPFRFFAVSIPSAEDTDPLLVTPRFFPKLQISERTFIVFFGSVI